MKEEVEAKKMKPTCVVSPLPNVSSLQGFTGLVNMGNTCFMNSVLQVLINTPVLKDYFLEKKYVEELNEDNPLGNGGRLARQFAVLTRLLWDGTKSSIAPSNLKRLVGEKAVQFAGFAQHDAQEFLAYLLDGLHEDLNRIKVKPYVMETSLDHLPAKEAAEETWRRYKSRNDSVVVDLFQGQYRSKVTCSVCHKVSLNFDPYMYLSVPIPKQKVAVTCVFFPIDGVDLPSKHLLHVPNECYMKEIGEELCKVVDLPSSQKLCYVFVEDRIPNVVGDMTKLTAGAPQLFIFAVNSLDSFYDEELTRICFVQRAEVQYAKCHHCGKSDSSKHSRCSRCRRVFYCDSECQKADWKSHMRQCRSSDGYCYIGQPFLINVPASQLTYSRLESAIESFARFSVNYIISPVEHQMDFASQDSPSKPKPKKFKIRICCENSELSQPLEDVGDNVLDVTDGYYSVDWLNKVEVSNRELMLQEEEKEGVTANGQTSCEEPEGITLEHCLSQFTREETLAASDSWYCPDCKTHREATKQMYLWSLPEVLIIQLKRFSFQSILYRKKLSEYIEYPLRGLDMRPFYRGPPMSPIPLYDLYGVVNHMGSLLGGHYTAYARNPNIYDSTESDFDWRLMDDTHVDKVLSEQNVISQYGYVLFYKRRNQAGINPESQLIIEKTLGIPTANRQQTSPSKPEPVEEHAHCNGDAKPDLMSAELTDLTSLPAQLFEDLDNFSGPVAGQNCWENEADETGIREVESKAETANVMNNQINGHTSSEDSEEKISFGGVDVCELEKFSLQMNMHMDLGYTDMDAVD